MFRCVISLAPCRRELHWLLGKVGTVCEIGRKVGFPMLTCYAIGGEVGIGHGVAIDGVHQTLHVLHVVPVCEVVRLCACDLACHVLSPCVCVTLTTLYKIQDVMTDPKE